MNDTTILAAVVLFVATATDVRDRKIYNSLTYPTIALGLLLAGAGTQNLDASPLRWSESLLAILGCGGVMLVPYFLSGGGAGDVKLAMAIGSLIGFDATVQGFCIGYIIAATFVGLRFAALATTVFVLESSSVQGRITALERIGREKSTGYLFRGTSSSGALHKSYPAPCSHSLLRRLGSQAEQPIPLAGFFACGMMMLFVTGPIW